MREKSISGALPQIPKSLAHCFSLKRTKKRAASRPFQCKIRKTAQVALQRSRTLPYGKSQYMIIGTLT